MSLTKLNRSVLSPLVAFSAMWLFGAALSQYHLLNMQTDWSIVMVGLVVVVPLSFLAGGLVGEGSALYFVGERMRSQTSASADRAFRKILVVFLLLGLAELVHQFIKIGGVPLLSGQGNSLRFQQGGPTIILTDLLTVVIIAALVKPQRLFAREARFELILAAVAMGGFALQAGRGSVVLPLIVVVAARWLYWGRPNMSLIGIAGLLAFAAVVFGFYLRARQNPTNPFEAELYSELLPGTPFFLQPLIPIYLAITTNFLALQGIVGHFPTEATFGGGTFDAIGLHSLIGGTTNLSDVSAGLTSPWVTSTVAGPLWADGGFAAVAFGVAVGGFASAGAFAMARITQSLRWSMIAAYLLYIAIFGIYTNLWTQHLDWLLVTPLLLTVGAVSENSQSPPGAVGWCLAQLSRVVGAPSRRDSAVKEEWGGDQPDREPRQPPTRRAGRAVMLLGIVVAAVLTVSGLVIQHLLPEPYPLVASKRLPKSIQRSIAVLTDNDLPSDNETLAWIDAHGHALTVHFYSTEGHSTSEPPPVHLSVPFNPRSASYDLNYWPPRRAIALFSFRQAAHHLSIRVTPTWRSDGAPVEYKAPISPAPAGATRDLMMATWSGGKPDLFVLTRGQARTRPVLQILSGESGFRRELYLAKLPFRGLSPREWSVDVGQLGTIPAHSSARRVVGTRPDLLLVHHDPNKARSDVQGMLGESGFQWDAFQRDLDTPGSVPPNTTFLIGSHEGSTSIFDVRADRHPRLGIFWFAPPAPFK